MYIHKLREMDRNAHPREIIMPTTIRMYVCRMFFQERLCKYSTSRYMGNPGYMTMYLRAGFFGSAAQYTTHPAEARSGYNIGATYMSALSNSSEAAVP